MALGTTIRTLWRQKEFSLLNILGLGVGIGSALLIFLIIRYELGIDMFHSKKDRIYRVVSMETYRDGTVGYDGCTPVPLAAAFRREFPQVERVAATWALYQQQFLLPSSNGEPQKKFRSGDVFYAQSSLFDIFDFPWIAGNPRTALNDPYTLAIARSVAKDWFGHWKDAMGKTILVGDDHQPVRITGVLEDPPANTDLSLRVVLSYATFRIRMAGQLEDRPGNWDSFSSGSQCFFLLPKGQGIQSMEALLPGFVGRHNIAFAPGSDSRDSNFFQPLKEIHFDTRFSHYGDQGWTYQELWSLGLIGTILLVVACINFINLSTAQSFKRVKEIGVRKVLGSSKSQLLVRFLGETLFLVVLALALGSILAELAMPALKGILQRDISLPLQQPLSTLLFLAGTGLVVTFLAGFYPGMVLSGFDPVGAIKSKINTKTIGGISLRRILVVLQFTIAQILIIGTLVIVQQLNFLHTRPLGFDRTAIALIDLPYSKEMVGKDLYFKNEVLQTPGVQATSLCNIPPISVEENDGAFTFENEGHTAAFELLYRYADSGYLSTFHIGLAAGRFPAAADTARELLINETAAHLLGFKNPEDILGRFIRLSGSSGARLPIAGVIRDFNSTSLKEKMSPLVVVPAASNFYTLAVRLDPARISETMSRVKKIYEQAFPDHIFNAPFLDDAIVGLYQDEAIQAKLFKIFAAMAIFISCLGLYGLISFMAAQKTKEVGIRKVLGASVQSIVYLFSREFTALIGLAFIIAAPVGYFFMEQWLKDFYYHTTIGWTVFATAIVLSILIAWATVGYRAIRAATANPVKALKYE